MENSTLDLIHRHASVRHYKPDPVPASIIETIVAAGQRASTSSNLQTYSVIAVTTSQALQRLSVLCGNQEHISQAPVFLAWCADLARLDLVCRMRGYTQVTGYVENFLVAATDTVIAAQNTALAAESLGLGICYIGSLRNDPQAVIDLLGLPPLTFPVTGMTIGWPENTNGVKPRLPLKAILHWEHYKNQYQEESLKEYDRLMIASGVYQGRQLTETGNAEPKEEYGWLEHTARRVSRAVRTDLRQMLQKQGFALE